MCVILSVSVPASVDCFSTNIFSMKSYSYSFNYVQKNCFQRKGQHLKFRLFGFLCLLLYQNLIESCRVTTCVFPSWQADWSPRPSHSPAGTGTHPPVRHTVEVNVLDYLPNKHVTVRMHSPFPNKQIETYRVHVSNHRKQKKPTYS